MATQDLLNIFLIIGFIIITICIVALTFYFIQALKSIQILAENLKDTTQSVKEKLQLRALAAIPALLLGIIGRFLRKRG